MCVCLCESKCKYNVIFVDIFTIGSTCERTSRSNAGVYYATIFLATLIVIGVRQFAQYLWKRTNCYKSALSTPARVQCHVLFKTAALITDNPFFTPCAKN